MEQEIKPKKKPGRIPLTTEQLIEKGEKAKELENKKKEAQRELVKRELARRHLLDFVQFRFPSYRVNWHHKILSDALERVEKGTLKRLIVNMPPRHGKSELVSVNFPAWAMGINKDRSIMACSYSAALATDFGRKVRNIMDEQEYKILFNTRLAEDAQAKGSWATNGRGEYNAIGVGGSATGKGCITGDTIISTDIGNIRLDILYQLWYNGYTDIRVLGYNHKTNETGYYPIRAAREIFNREVQTISTTDGKSISATPDHKFFTVEQGYTPLEEINTGQNLKTINLSNELFILPKDVQKEIIRDKESFFIKCKRILLFKRLFPETSFNKKQKNVSCLPEQSSKENTEILLSGVQKKYVEEIRNNKLFRVWNNISTQISFNKILFNVLQKFISLKGNEGKESKLQTWNVFRGLSKRIQNEKIFNKKRQKQEMYCVFSEKEVSCSPQRPKSNKQRGQESSLSLQQLPHNTPQVKNNPVSDIVISGINQTVYDIQVDEVENFFANGVLVHNCSILIIDDPVKNREEADSEIVSESIWDWYRSTARTRLTPDGAVVLVMTRWKDNDLCGRILEEAAQQSSEKWEVVTMPAIAEQDEKERKEGEALWADHFTLENLNQVKNDIGSYEFQSQYQQNPVNRETQIFKEELFRYISWDSLKAKHTSCYVTIDSALSKKKNSDNTGVCINWVDEENLWHLKAYKVKVDPSELIQLIFDLHQAYKPNAIGLEETLMTQAIDPFLTVEMGKRNIFPNVVPLKHGGVNKEVRIKGLLPRYERGYIYHIDGMCRDLENEALRFPASAHDDVLDAVAYQVQLAEVSDNSFDWDEFEDSELNIIAKHDDVLYDDIGI